MRWVGSFLGLLLLAAAVLKIFPGHAVHHDRFRDTALPLGEIILASWLISGVKLEGSLRVATALFFCFAMATLWMIARGFSNCGCFGAVSLSPKATYWIDLSAFLAAIAARRHVPFRQLVSEVLLPGLILYSSSLVAAHLLHSDAKIEVGKPWPPYRAVECTADLSKGRWIVLIYSSNCARCESLATVYTRDASEWAAQGKMVRLALLDADAQENSATLPSVSGMVRGDLLQSELYQHSPILLLLDQGLVQAVEEGWAAADWSYPPYSSWVR